ncbi:hypothetical protein ACEQPO_28270 [Bacillus sp. SL00103]
MAVSLDLSLLANEQRAKPRGLSFLHERHKHIPMIHMNKTMALPIVKRMVVGTPSSVKKRLTAALTKHRTNEVIV